MTTQTIQLNGKSYVILERKEFERLESLANGGELPSLPAPDADGNFPAVEYARVSLARKIIRDRVAAGLSQKELAKLAKIRVESLSRIESGTQSPSVSTVDRIDRILSKLLGKKKG